VIEAVSATAPVKPYCGEMVRVVVAFVPWLPEPVKRKNCQWRR